MIRLKYLLLVAAAAMLLACFNILSLKIALQTASEAVCGYILGCLCKGGIRIVMAPGVKRRKKAGRRVA